MKASSRVSVHGRKEGEAAGFEEEERGGAFASIADEVSIFLSTFSYFLPAFDRGSQRRCELFIR